ncbi:MAG: bifunctional folylpolyglutamate synthase/dihydrofolate synthase [Candidatus Binatia bacterium]
MLSYSETLNYIFNLRGGSIDLRLHRMEQALSLFGYPQRRYPALHIAGTNGKGSTAAMLHRILSAEGYHVALYTSPHVVSFTERIRVGEHEISPGEVIELAETVKRRTVKEGISLTFFEFVTVMALVYFASRKVELAVVEVGLGGRCDATNLVLPRASIITNISRDHEAYLGADLLSIAREKGGIIKAGTPVVCGSLSQELADFFLGVAETKGSESYFFGRDFSLSLKEGGLFDYKGLKWHLQDLTLALRGQYERDNAALVLGALEVIHGDFPVSEASVRKGLDTVFWPGRFEWILRHPTVILDGAHNGGGTKALVNEIRSFQGLKKVKLLFAAMRDKDWHLMLRELAAVTSEIVLTRVPMKQCADPRRLTEAVPKEIPMAVIDDPREAIRFLIRGAKSDQTILVAGSLYLLGEVRPFLADMADRESAETPVAIASS